MTFVKTGRFNSKRRELVRKMLSSDTSELQAYFIIGTGSDESHSSEPEVIEEEQSTYGDLIIGNFVDIYENLPLKTMLGYQFKIRSKL